jgi:hypothetical protein
MSYDQNTVSLVVAGLLLCLIFVVLLLLWRRARRKGSSKVALLGATYEFYNADQRAAVETIVEQDVEKPKESQETGEPPDSIDEPVN